MICWKGWHTGKESKWQAEKRPFPKGTPFRTHIFLPTCSWWMIFWNSCNSFYLLFPTLWVGITDSFLPYWVFSYMYLFTVDTCLSGKGWTPGRHNRGWGKKSIPKGSCSLLKSISHHLHHFFLFDFHFILKICSHLKKEVTPIQNNKGFNFSSVIATFFTHASWTWSLIELSKITLSRLKKNKMLIIEKLKNMEKKNI